ncbi:MAG: Lpg1974 family pore-forming outer membrane protein [Parachlamydiaceae bacterium]
MSKYILAFLCVLSSSLFATIHPEPGQWGATGEYLYMKPLVDDSYFVIKSPNTVNIDHDILVGEEKNNEFDFSSGYRVGISYTFCESDSEIALFYTQLDANHNRTISGDILSPTIGIEEYFFFASHYKGIATSKLGIQYQRADGVFAQRVYQKNNFDLRAIFGIEYAGLNGNENIHYSPNSVIPNEFTSSNSLLKKTSKTWGIGPEVGVDFNYELYRFSDCLPSSLNVNFLSTGSILLSRCKSTSEMVYTVLTGTYNYDVQQEKSTRIIPAFHARLGFNYDFHLCDFEGSIGVGCEFNTYIKALMSTINSSFYGYTGLTNTEYNDFVAQGFFANLSVKF